jgi:putative restriction endonuclease
MRKVNISSQTYTILDTIEKITVADSFVLNPNKLGGGNGEAKLYIGNDNSELRNFYGNKGFNINCFMLRADLLRYLYDCEAEYKNPTQEYRSKDELPYLWQERLTKVSCFPEVLYFNLEEQTQIAGPRIYVKSDSLFYSLIRELSLPTITYLSLMKLADQQGEINYYLKLFSDNLGNKHHPSELRQEIEELDKEAISEDHKTVIIKAEAGQGKFRKALLDSCPYCIITNIEDERLLVATHIKPWIRSDLNEKANHLNGLILTPTFSHLFVQGFISFTNDKKLLVSPWLSDKTCTLLNITHDMEYPDLQVEGRRHFLEYHRTHIFKG